MFSPSPLPRNLEASFRDLASLKAATRASAVRDIVSHSLRSDATRSRAIPLLEQILRDDGVPVVRAAAAVGLADIVAGEALATLLVAVEDDDSHVRQMALAAIGEIGDPRATQRLERALRDARPDVRYQALIAFARVAKDDEVQVATALVRALDDPDEAIRYIAMRLAEEHFAANPSAKPDERLTARAERLVDSDDPSVAIVAALYLARLGHPRAGPVLLDVIAETRRTPELEDEQACVELAGELQLTDAIPHLERRAWGTRRVVRAVLSWGAGDSASCAWHARIALARMGHPRARTELMGELVSWRRETRNAAVVAVGRAHVLEARETLRRLLAEEAGVPVDAALVREALVRLAVE
ncbi:MAG: HEAT repeat domain-containing protein [Myxococcota bacterium]|nr:HEAT repeat domain-containing protein [Myxococcota bacterium]